MTARHFGEFNFTGPAGLVLVVEASTNLHQWTKAPMRRRGVISFESRRLRTPDPEELD